MRSLKKERSGTAWATLLSLQYLLACAPLESVAEGDLSADAGFSDLDDKAANVCGTAAESEKVSLSCPSGSLIERITFASYGTPNGTCATGFSNGKCHASTSLQEVQDACVGKQSCGVAASNATFKDPCGGVAKRLAVTYACGTTTASAMPVFLMAGQSNMIGNVDSTLFDQLLSELSSGSTSTTGARLKSRLSDWYLNNNGGYASYGYSDAMATLESSELIRLKNAGLVGAFLKTPLSSVTCAMNGARVSGLATNCGNIFGAELVLGHYLNAKGHAPTSLIKVAKGGTTLYGDWRSPKTVAQSGGSVGALYTQLQSRIDSLRSSPASVDSSCASKSCRWGGFIWFQGENDTMDQTSANAYAKNLANLIGDVRGRVGSSKLPVVIVEIGKWAQTMDYGATVLSAQRSVVAADANTRIVKTDDLSGFYHYDPAAQLIIGERVGIALTSMLGGLVDNCPNDPNKIEPGACGCGVPEGTCSGGGTACVTAGESASASLSCSGGQVISSISFASYGAPSGACPNVTQGTCHASNSLSKVQSLCLYKPSCSVAANNDLFDDPCPGAGKKLAVKYTCSGAIDTSAIENAMAALANHVKGTSVLSAAQIAAHKSTIDDNLLAMGSNSLVIAKAFDLVDTYESVIGPLFMNAANANMGGQSWNPGFERKALKNDIHMAILDVMQGIVDKAYAGQNVSQFESVLRGRKFKSSDYFPGKVTSTPNPSVVHTATIKGDYPKAWGHPVMNDNIPFARKPTGTYLAPGSIATVTVPQSLVGKGFQVRVGAHVEDYSKSNDFIRRLDRVSIAYPINSVTTKVGNPLGGGIYIDVPALASAGAVTVQIQNAVRSPYYSNTSLRKTTLAEWQNTERNFGAPWADFQTEKFMVQIPTSWIYNYADPSVFLTFWDNSLDVVSDLMGFPRARNKEVLYMLPDRSWRYGVGAPGYPSTNTLYVPQQATQNAITMGPSALYDAGFQTELHELGHGHLFAKLAGSDTESAVEILAAAVANRKYGKSMDEAHKLAVSALPVPFNKSSYITLSTTAIEWMMCENFKLGKAMSAEEGRYQLKGSAKYIQIADVLGWQVLDNFWRSINVDTQAGVKVDTSTNGLILRMSKAAGVDVTPLLHFWGNMPIDVQSMKAAIAAANIPRSAKIYDRLVQYQSSVPANNQAFRTFAQTWWGKQPSSSGYGTEAYHAQLWNSYDESYAALTKSNIQKMITLYFPSGRP